MKRLTTEERDVLAGCASALHHPWGGREDATIWALRARGLVSIRMPGGIPTAFATAEGLVALACYEASEPGKLAI